MVWYPYYRPNFARDYTPEVWPTLWCKTELTLLYVHIGILPQTPRRRTWPDTPNVSPHIYKEGKCGGFCMVGPNGGLPYDTQWRNKKIMGPMNETDDDNIALPGIFTASGMWVMTNKQIQVARFAIFWPHTTSRLSLGETLTHLVVGCSQSKTSCSHRPE